jgi:hypothetical protein
MFITLQLACGGYFLSFAIQRTSEELSAECEANNSYNRNTSVGQANTTSNGVAMYKLNCPADGEVYAYYARTGAIDGCDQPQNMASSPVQLTVGYNTTLLLSVSRQNSSDTHVFMARLVDNAGNGLGGRLLTEAERDRVRRHDQQRGQRDLDTLALT